MPATVPAASAAGSCRMRAVVQAQPCPDIRRAVQQHHAIGDAKRGHAPREARGGQAPFPAPQRDEAKQQPCHTARTGLGASAVELRMRRILAKDD